MQMWIPMQPCKGANGNIYMWCKCPYEYASVDFHASWCKCPYQDVDFFFMMQMLYSKMQILSSQMQISALIMLKDSNTNIFHDANTCECNINQMFFQIKTLWSPKSRFWEAPLILSVDHLFHFDEA